jgi:membrane protease YdiL (CAAX protease family)
MLAGLVAEMTAWWAVATRRASVWRVLPAVLGAMGIAGALARRPVWAGHVGAASAICLGAGTGFVLYAATRAFVWVATWWEPFRVDVVRQYRYADEASRAVRWTMSLGVMVPAEELFWRGLFQAHLTPAWGAGSAALVTWLAYVTGNSTSRSLSLIAGAIAGGGLWVALAWWSGGMLASLASHILWTGLMLAVPPGAGRAAEGSI